MFPSPSSNFHLISTVENNSMGCYYSGNVLNLYKWISESEKIKGRRNMFSRSTGDNLSAMFLECFSWEICIGHRIPRLRWRSSWERGQGSHSGTPRWVDWALERGVWRCGMQKHCSWPAWERSGRDGAARPEPSGRTQTPGLEELEFKVWKVKLRLRNYVCRSL